MRSQNFKNQGNLINAENERKNERLLYIFLISLVFYFISYPIFHNNGLHTILWMATILCLAVFLVQMINLIDSQFFIIFLLLFLSIVCSILINDGAMGVSQILAIVLFLLQVFSIKVFSSINVNKSIFYIIFKFIFLIAILFVIYSFTPIAMKVTTNGYEEASSLYVFNLDNSNFAGMCLLCIYSLLLFGFFMKKNKTLSLILAVIIFYLLIKTAARASIAGAIFITIISFLFVRRKINSAIIIMSLIFPVIFSFAYIYLATNMNIEIEILGKAFFTGREEMFENAINELLSKPSMFLFGDVKANYFQNAHNAPIAIALSCGVFGLCVFYSFLLIVLKKASKNNNKISNLGIINILGISIASSAEASFFLGGFPMIIFVIIFILMANYKEEGVNQ